MPLPPPTHHRESAQTATAGTPLSRVISVLELLAPVRFAESWDNVGLLLGDQASPITRVLVTNDCTPDVVKEAVALGADLIVSYHPILFKATRTLTTPNVAYDALRHGIAVYSPHTALDAVERGPNGWLAQLVELQAPKPLRLLPSERRATLPDSSVGMGRIGDRAPIHLRELIAKIGVGVGLQHLSVAGGLDRTVTRVAVAAGAGGSLLHDAVAQGAQVYVTGELSHHEALAATQAGLTVICTTHSRSERPALPMLRDDLAHHLSGVDVVLSRVDADPFAVVSAAPASSD